MCLIRAFRKLVLRYLREQNDGLAGLASVLTSSVGFLWEYAVDQGIMNNMAWERTVGQLDPECARRMSARVRRILSSHALSRKLPSYEGLSVVPLERISPTASTVSWCVPQACNYGGQIWRFAKAKWSGTCVLTGKSISRGESIYRPMKAEPLPINVNAMMLAVALDDALSD